MVVGFGRALSSGRERVEGGTMTKVWGGWNGVTSVMGRTDGDVVSMVGRMTLAKLGFEGVLGVGVYATLANVGFEGFARVTSQIFTLAKSLFFDSSWSYLFSITAPPAPFPTALHLNRAANTVLSGAPLQPRRQHHSQRRSASTAPPTPFLAALHFQTAPPTPFLAALHFQTAPPTPFSAALHFQTAPPSPFPAALRLNRAANTVSQRRSASTAPPSPFPAALHLNLVAHRVSSITLRSLQEYSGCQDDATKCYRINVPSTSPSEMSLSNETAWNTGGTKHVQ